MYGEYELVNAYVLAKTMTESNQAVLDDAFFTAHCSQPHFRLNSNLFRSG